MRHSPLSLLLSLVAATSAGSQDLTRVRVDSVFADIAPNEPLVTQLQFRRDAAGRVVEFTITTPPGADVVRDLRFVRTQVEQRRQAGVPLP